MSDSQGCAIALQLLLCGRKLVMWIMLGSSAHTSITQYLEAGQHHKQRISPQQGASSLVGTLCMLHMLTRRLSLSSYIIAFAT